jgi:hypothetical protein
MNKEQRMVEEAMKLINSPTKRLQPFHAAAVACQRAGVHDDETFNVVHALVVKRYAEESAKERAKEKHDNGGNHHHHRHHKH